MKWLTVCCTCLVIGISNVANAGSYTYNSANDVIVDNTADDTDADTVNQGGYSFDWEYERKGEVVGTNPTIARAYSSATISSLNNTTATMQASAIIEIQRTFTFVRGVPGETPVFGVQIGRYGSYSGNYYLSNTITNGAATATVTQTAEYAVNRGGTSTANTATNTLTRTNNGNSGVVNYGPTPLTATIESVAGALTIPKNMKVSVGSTATGITSGGNLADAYCGPNRNEISVSNFVAMYMEP